ncbi:phosphoribosylanthranilate isomerase [Leucobacter sp. CSA2]|uniref:N-(5'-phosphoribosyl)anthranilate isomerase n=1 Tax=Leucobacter edaphi TaxID=2796472 RepID=A0A934QDS4_9MICO|nr:phosphoribosylanthranilate isomerase [Leucobacter edaphi]MBK0421374.1 phosphoribosylanthranilate isomerase [Leucobacter edaphi]
MYVKICGLRDPEHATLAASLGADAVGVVMASGSPRNASPQEASAVIAAARAASPDIDAVLVVADVPAVRAAELARELGFDILQLHGSYTAEDIAAARALLPRVWRATSLASDPGVRAGDYGEERLLIDGAVAGSGERWDLSGIAAHDLGPEWILAGGLSPGTVQAAIRAAAPWGVDVSSGVESSRGHKDPELIREFIALAKNSDS